MGKNATGALTRFTGFTQSAFGAVPDPAAGEVLYLSTLAFGGEPNLEPDPTLGSGYRGEQKGDEGRFDPTGTATAIIGTSIGFWLKHLIGAPVTTGAAGAYTHTFAVGNGAQAIPPALLIERDFGDRIAGTGRIARDQDVRIGSAAFAFTTGGPHQTVNYNLVGARKVALPALPLDDTPEDYGHKAFVLSGLTLVLDEGATEVCVETLNINWDNDLDTDLFCLNDGGQRHDLPEGQVRISGDGVAQFDTAALLLKAQADQSLALRIRMRRGSGAGTVGNEELTLNVPLSALVAPVPGVTGPRGLKQAFSFRAYRPENGEVGVTAVLKSPRAVI
ncbi:phage tail tube protein [Luteimonas terrae]|uniref:Uncharacterized protein n=1 Tax=Luteimonas terrae TaxID=1530191 RepID=A0ABU1XX80_9GAMM|nr:phage tail tube protein [Luteimonas terrae]MDR7193351.1 hypothetical protein [Luteimonas terrae]